MEVNSNEIINGMSAIMPGQIWFFEVGDRSPVCTMTKNRPHLILSANSREIVCLPLTHQNSANSNWKVPVINSDKGTKSYILTSRPITLYIDTIKSKMRYYTTLSPNLFKKVVATFIAAMFGAYYGDDIVRVANEALDVFNNKNEYDYMSFMPYDYYSIDGIMSKINVTTSDAPKEVSNTPDPAITKNAVFDVLNESGIDVNALKAICANTVNETNVVIPEETQKTESSKSSKTITTKKNLDEKPKKPKGHKAEDPFKEINGDIYVMSSRIAKLFPIASDTVSKYEKMGLIKPLKDGRFKFIKVSELNDVINNHKAKNGPKPKKRPTLELPDSKLKAAESSKEIQEQEPDTISNGTLPAKIKNRKEFVKGMIVPVCDLDKTTSTSVYEIANAFRNITGNDMTWSEAKGIMNNLCIENHDIKHRDFSSTEFSVKLTMSISEGQKKLKAKQIISDIKTYGEEIAKRKWSIDDTFIEINCKETCK